MLPVKVVLDIMDEFFVSCLEYVHVESCEEAPSSFDYVRVLQTGLTLSLETPFQGKFLGKLGEIIKPQNSLNNRTL